MSDVNEYMRRMSAYINENRIYEKNNKKNEALLAYERSKGIRVIRDATKWPRRVICQKCYSEIEYDEPATHTISGNKIDGIRCPVCDFYVYFDGEKLLSINIGKHSMWDGHWR